MYTCVALTSKLHCHVLLYFENFFTGAICLLPVVYGFFIGRSTRDTPPTHNIPLYTSGLWGHRIASLWLGMGNGSSRFTSFFFSFVAVLGWAGWGWWYGYCIHMHCARWMYVIFPAYYHTLRYIYASLRMNIPYNIHLSLNAILPLFPASIEISMLVPFFNYSYNQD